MQKSAEKFVISLPPEYQPRHQWPEYAAHLDMPSFFRPAIVGTHPRGMRRGIWPFIIEGYVSDTEPADFTSDPGACNRIIQWVRLIRQDIPPGWRTLSSEPSELEGFFDLRAFPEYQKQWIKVARYDLRQWHTIYSSRYVIEKISWSEYAQTCKSSTINKKIGLVVQVMKRKWQCDPGQVIFWGAREKSTGEVVACIGVINSPTHQASYYATGCMRTLSGYNPVMVGLIDHWFQTSQKQHLRFLHFGQFWMSGKPVSWKGFTTFKLKFNPQLLLYPPTLYRFERGTLF